MNDAQLRCFHLAATEESITRAAARLGISQPTVSAQIKTLEEGYGVQLFRRVGRKIELTDFGAHLKAITERIYAAQDEARELLIGHQNLSKGHLRIGAVGPFHVFPVLRELGTKYPDVTFSLRSGNSTSIYDALARYDIDVGILADLKPGDRKFHIQFLRRDDIVLLVNRDHPFAAKAFVSYAELAHETIILREQGSVTRSTFLSALIAEDHSMPRFLEIETREATKEAVACGFGIAPLLRSEAGEDERCTLVRIAPLAPGFDEYVACPRDLIRTPLIKAFLDAASTVSAQLDMLKAARADN
ncbi:LysR family transcriptional regulator [Bosea caraganae]|uniref:LysR family transcriptional regulator n=1 Tax=Bosea caraganae TaxID=2763117 RepID=A0A370L046_9HYPH|nr:LysR substrate-binding domain-containing protein [Bosea caraganae]RDJ20623.1 LysR family transcriptional regulator [Bosea caraganae]RDJ28900.1 LysR family transcriptional regulator [Bosea caraganae]